jgi:hypothetical protein
MKYKVTRAFLLAGQRQEIGSEIDLTDRDLIGSLKSAGKIEPATPEPANTGPMTTENSGLVAKAKKTSKE